MHLKRIELVGFKSFAQKTILEIPTGMTAIVGPNGCGKSNIADAVRWVLGEQSAKALRGGKMQDVIFSGTDTHKPLGMAEVSLAMADCESDLATEFNEVTVTRRVFRSGEGQYFINKTPCRLKDIQRLFMDTGIGTNSYSLMEQGRIDLILSSRPEDRRAVFEEASGITKYKADKKQALRKLEHTEANLLRLEDIIREVRRQIISLQRQAGKARRYQDMQEKLRGFDLYLTRNRLRDLEASVRKDENVLASIREQEEAARQETGQVEQAVTETRALIEELEQRGGETMEAAAAARSAWERTGEQVRVSEDRIREMQDLSERDARDAGEMRRRVEEHRAGAENLAAEVATAAGTRDAGEEDLNAHAERLAERERCCQEVEQRLHRLRSELVDLESRSAHLQNEQAQMEAQERTTVLRRERLAAEQSEMRKAAKVFADRETRMQGRFQELQGAVDSRIKDVDGAKNRVKEAREQAASHRQALGERRTDRATRQARIDLLRQDLSEARGFPGGARVLLGADDEASVDTSAVLGALSEHLRAEDGYQPALESVLRSWLDAVVVRDEATARALLAALQKAGRGSARMLTTQLDISPKQAVPDLDLPRLADHVTCPDPYRPLVDRLLGNVFVVESTGTIPTREAGAMFVTRDGALARENGAYELWQPGAEDANPLARQHLLSAAEQELARAEREADRLQRELDQAREREQQAERDAEKAGAELEAARHELAVCEGENQVVAQEAAQARDRLDTVTFELEALAKDGDSAVQRQEELRVRLDEMRDRRDDIRKALTDDTESLHGIEQGRNELRSVVTEKRVALAHLKQRVEFLESQRDGLLARVQETEAVLTEREAGITSHRSRIEELSRQRDEAQARLAPMKEEAGRLQDQLEQVRSERQEKVIELAALEGRHREKRDYLDSLHERKSEAEVHVAEQRLRHQTQIDRIATEYRIGADEVMKLPDPEWEDGEAPDHDVLETTIGELRAKLDSMGPVNLVAIEEHAELEERYAFLTQQQEDLVNAKQQLLDLIKKINRTTTEMFSNTFEKVNENFQGLFKQLFGGGTAKLVMVDEEDVLESGIEIIARPPGKKLQTVSLLSGGERTMTAVALLFSLYMVKPSPFCMLDELDAALDEANIGRFVEMLKGFLEDSQFVVITHSRRTIAASDVLYGVTMEKQGVSSIVSVRFADHGEEQNAVPT